MMGRFLLVGMGRVTPLSQDSVLSVMYVGFGEIGEGVTKRR